MKFKEKSCLNDIKVQDEAVSIDTEAAASHPEDPDEFMKVTTINNRFSIRMCHLELS